MIDSIIDIKEETLQDEIDNNPPDVTSNSNAVASPDVQETKTNSQNSNIRALLGQPATRIILTPVNNEDEANLVQEQYCWFSRAPNLLKQDYDSLKVKTDPLFDVVPRGALQPPIPLLPQQIKLAGVKRKQDHVDLQMNKYPSTTKSHETFTNKILKYGPGNNTSSFMQTSSNIKVSMESSTCINNLPIPVINIDSCQMNPEIEMSHSNSFNNIGENTILKVAGDLSTPGELFSIIEVKDEELEKDTNEIIDINSSDDEVDNSSANVEDYAQNKTLHPLPGLVSTVRKQSSSCGETTKSKQTLMVRNDKALRMDQILHSNNASQTQQPRKPSNSTAPSNKYAVSSYSAKKSTTANCSEVVEKTPTSFDNSDSSDCQFVMEVTEETDDELEELGQPKEPGVLERINQLIEKNDKLVSYYVTPQEYHPCNKVSTVSKAKTPKIQIKPTVTCGSVVNTETYCSYHKPSRPYPTETINNVVSSKVRPYPTETINNVVSSKVSHRRPKTKKHKPKPKASVKIQCKHCKLSFNTKTEMDDHIEASLNNCMKFPCLICRTYFCNYVKFNDHMADAHKTCKVCNEKFKSKYEYTLHENEHRKGSILFYHCPHCINDYKDKKSVREHIEKVHPGKTTKISEYIKKNLPFACSVVLPMQCVYCDRVFANNEELIQHLKSHNIGLGAK